MQLQVDSTLLSAILDGTAQGLAMTDTVPTAIGASKIFAAHRPISIVVGLAGPSNGTVTVNVTERTLLHLTGRMLGEDQTEINETNLDCAMEIGNIIAGTIKNHLSGQGQVFTGMSVPSLFLGANYNVYFSRGITTVTVEFEIEEIPVSRLQDRFFAVSVSQLRQTK